MGGSKKLSHVPVPSGSPACGLYWPRLTFNSLSNGWAAGFAPADQAWWAPLGIWLTQSNFQF